MTTTMNTTRHPLAVPLDADVALPLAGPGHTFTFVRPDENALRRDAATYAATRAALATIALTSVAVT